MAPKRKLVKSKVSSSNKTINAFFKAGSNAPLPPVDPPQKVTVTVELHADHSAADGKLGDRAVTTTPISPIVTVDVAAASRLSIAKWSDEITAYSDRSDAESTAPASEDTVTVSPPVAVSEIPSTVPDKKRRRIEHKLFPQKWLKQYSWIRHNHADNVLSALHRAG